MSKFMHNKTFEIVHVVEYIDASNIADIARFMKLHYLEGRVQLYVTDNDDIKVACYRSANSFEYLLPGQVLVVLSNGGMRVMATADFIKEYVSLDDVADIAELVTQFLNKICEYNGATAVVRMTPDAEQIIITYEAKP